MPAAPRVGNDGTLQVVSAAVLGVGRGTTPMAPFAKDPYPDRAQTCIARESRYGQRHIGRQTSAQPSQQCIGLCLCRNGLGEVPLDHSAAAGALRIWACCKCAAKACDGALCVSAACPSLGELSASGQSQTCWPSLARIAQNMARIGQGWCTLDRMLAPGATVRQFQVVASQPDTRTFPTPPYM